MWTWPSGSCERLSGPVSIEDVAGKLDISARSFQLAFRTVREKTPTDMLRRLRLDQARGLLMSAGEAPRVTDVALSCGMTHFGRFTQACRIRFGESPFKTLARLNHGIDAP